MANLVEKIKTFFVGKTSELKEKGTGYGLYVAEICALGWFLGDAMDGKFNQYLAPFALDAAVRIANTYARLGNYGPRDEVAMDFPGLIGAARELR